MIPALVTIPGAPFRVLPPGIHWASLSDIQARFAVTLHRQTLCNGVLQVAKALKLAGCQLMYIDGSFVTDKPYPGDFDGCWDARGVSFDKLDKTLLDFSHKRKAQKEKYRGEMFISTTSNEGSRTFLDFFQIEKHTGAAKGILGINLHAAQELGQ